MAERKLPRAWLLPAAVLLATLALAASGGQRRAAACAFLRTPSAYEAEQARTSYLAAIDAAAVDGLFPGDSYFGLPQLMAGTRAARVPAARRVPSTVLKAISWEESTLTMASRATRFESTGPALVSFDCGHGAMQVTTGMTVPLGTGADASARQVNVATHYVYNVARGVAILADKWNQAPALRPIVGTDTGGDPNLIENWYYAVWAYNGFAGPGSSSTNHPLDPLLGAWPRPAYRCDGTQARNRYPYQELVWGCMANPPERFGRKLWTPLPATLPDFSLPQFFGPMSLARWVFPYSGMDLPTAQPAHLDLGAGAPPGFRDRALGAPTLGISSGSVVIRLNGTPQEQRATIRVQNPGTGILTWYASSTDRWIVVDPPAGVALGSDVACAAPDCTREAAVTITVNPTLLPQANLVGTLRITAANGQLSERSVRVEVNANFDVAAPGTGRAY
ncbi:MAG: hypothetical protein EXR65_02970 [Dehalococcoidia bacterium]|nr:hypothetical protein [Dehalococcoidia bacterium]